jgi:hypothetical protein
MITGKKTSGFTLLETVTVLLIATMIIISAMAIYGRVKSASASVKAKLNSDSLAREIIQRIAEDLDRLAAPGLETEITIKNKFESGYDISQMVIENKIYNNQNKPEVFEKIVWQSNVDPFLGELVLYRSHSGLNLEDRIIDAELEEIQQLGSELFVPVAEGLSHFKIVVPKQMTPAQKEQEMAKEEETLEIEEPEYIEMWTSSKLPSAVIVQVSFAELEESISGELEVLDEDITERTIAIDRTREIPFKFIRKQFDDEYAERLEEEQEQEGTDEAENMEDPNDRN